MRRNGRPGLIGTMARTAVIAGTAQAVTGNVAARQNAAAQQQAAAQQAAAPAAAPVAAPADDSTDIVAQLTKLNQLKAAGLIDDAEFAAAKAKALGI